MVRMFGAVEVLGGVQWCMVQDHAQGRAVCRPAGVERGRGVGVGDSMGRAVATALTVWRSSGVLRRHS